MEAREELRQEAKNESGLAKFILEKVGGYMDKYLSRIVGRLLTKKGIGLEHPVDNVRVTYKGGSLTFLLKEKKLYTYQERD